MMFLYKMHDIRNKIHFYSTRESLSRKTSFHTLIDKSRITGINMQDTQLVTPPENYDMLRCGPSSSLDYLDLEDYDKRGEIQQLYIYETPVGFYVCAQLTIAKKIWYLTTQRDRYTPYIFKDLHRLNDYLRNHWPQQNIVLRRNQKIPQPVNATAKPRSKKVLRKLIPKNTPKE